MERVLGNHNRERDNALFATATQFGILQRASALEVSHHGATDLSDEASVPEWR